MEGWETIYSNLTGNDFARGFIYEKLSHYSPDFQENSAAGVIIDDNVRIVI
jgi:hypothetical protein